MIKNIGIIGGSGFIGTRLSKNLLLNKRYSLYIIDKVINQSFEKYTRIADVRSVKQIRDAIEDESIIINLAAEHRDDVWPLSQYEEVNVQGAINICVVAREKNVKTIIFTSSVAVYGFAPVGTDETGCIDPFNEYGRTKYAAEQIFRGWQAEAPSERSLVIIRPTVVFGEQNRGNVYNLLKLIASDKFFMVGNGENRKSMAYVENVAAFIEYSLLFKPGVHLYNFIDKPDFTMNQLFISVKRVLGQSEQIGFRLPYAIGYTVGKLFDFFAAITGKRLAISSIRVKKFCSNSMFNTAIDETGFIPPIGLEKALEQTILYEFTKKQQ
jgi:nucleoside-diphosphate-sugar epimerase